MARRSLPLLLALAVAAAPVALDVCQLTCAWATRHAQTGDTARDQSCHHQDVPAGTTISTAPHSCAHAAELPAASSAGTSQVANSSAQVVAAAVQSTNVIHPETIPDQIQRASVFPQRTGSGPAMPLRI
jgi:hypothetical protein